MYDICCIGHITLDKVVTPSGEKYMAGGTSFYFSNALQHMDISYGLVTSLAETEMHFVEELRARKIEVEVIIGKHTLYFENIYLQNIDQRTQRVLQTGDSFTVNQLKNTRAAIFHLGPLLAGDIPLDLIKYLAAGSKVSLDVQGYLRKVEDKNVCAIDWLEKKEALRYVHFLKANDAEMFVLTGIKDVKKSAEILSGWGIKEVIITLGSQGSVIFCNGIFYEIPAYKPAVVVDATGCGDTYMAGYLYKRIKGAGIQDAGEFAAAMASLKIESYGAFTGTEPQVLDFLANSNAGF